MNQASTHQIAPKRRLPATRQTPRRVEDSSGYVIFSKGDAGNAHVIAHRMLDQGRIALGHQRLGAWLDGKSGSGSDWAHLHFHMAIFELGIGDWNGAYERFLSELLPVAETSTDALTDGPGLLWRLAITAPTHIALPWEALRGTALESMRQIRDPFVELHHLLAFAGAGDRGSIDAWLRMHAHQIRTQRDRLVVEAGHALRHYADGAFAAAAAELDRLAPQMPKVGGSRAQNELFGSLAVHCRRLVALTSKIGHRDLARERSITRKTPMTREVIGVNSPRPSAAH